MGEAGRTEYSTRKVRKVKEKKSKGERVEKETGRKNYPGIEGNEGFPGGSETNCQCRRHRRRRREFDPWVGKIPWRREWQPTPIFFPGEFHEQRSLVGYSLRTWTRLKTRAHTHTHTHTLSLSLSLNERVKER